MKWRSIVDQETKLLRFFTKFHLDEIKGGAKFKKTLFLSNGSLTFNFRHSSFALVVKN